MTNKYLTVFVADDDEDDREMIKRAFDVNDYHGEICFAVDGVELMDMVSNHIPDIILLDLNMPKKNGLEVLIDIRSSEKYRKIPIIILSTSSSETDINLCYHLGCNCYMIKPENFKDLTNSIKSITQYWLGLYKLPIDMSKV